MKNSDLALEVIPYFRLSPEKAEEIISKVKLAVSKWRVLAKKYGISTKDQDLMAKAFRN